MNGDATNDIRSGWLHKRSGGLFPRWQLRHAQCKGGTLYLRHQPTSEKCRTIHVVSVAAPHGTRMDIVLVSKDGLRVQLRCASETECEQWRESLQAQSCTPASPPSASHPVFCDSASPAAGSAASRATFPDTSSAATQQKQQQQAFRQLARANSLTAPSPSEPPMSLFAHGRDMHSQTYLAGEYSGEFVKGERHGIGRFVYCNGNLYTGAWQHDRKDGFGMLRWSNGDTYTGEWKENQMSGFGLFVYCNGNSYTGVMDGDRKHGQGRFTWSNGDAYDGEWTRDSMSGLGTISYNNGNVYIGSCRGNVKHGQGRMMWKSGDIYQGEWESGLMHGEGSFWYSDGGHYAGTWCEDRRQGKGMMIEKTGDEYTGEWTYDMRHGEGSCAYANGDWYAGSFTGNLRHGFGVYTAGNAAGDAAGDKYTGNWSEDQKHGQGKYVWADGDVYEGSWQSDMRNDEGTCTYSNGDRYIGQWKDDMRHGKGRLVWADGNTYEGGWKNDNISPGSQGNPRQNRSTGSYKAPSEALSPAQSLLASDQHLDPSTYAGGLGKSSASKPHPFLEHRLQGEREMDAFSNGALTGGPSNYRSPSTPAVSIFADVNSAVEGWLTGLQLHREPHPPPNEYSWTPDATSKASNPRHTER